MPSSKTKSAESPRQIVQLRDVQHQSRAQRLIQQALSSDRLPHAYIFHGPDGVGKEMFAHGLAKLMLCESSTGGEGDAPSRDSCGICRSCVLVDAGNHPDLHLVYRQLAASHPDSAVRARKALDLGVDVIRHFVIDAVGLRPTVGPVKVFIIREADKITPQAQNALLKTLEEPPETTFLIMLASAADRLLATTRSRCQMVGFASLPSEFVARRLGELVDGLDAKTADLLAVLAQGSLGRAVLYAQDGFAELFGEVSEMLAGLDRMSAAKHSKRIVELAKESANRYKQRDKNLSDAAARRVALADILGSMATWYGSHLHAAAGRPHPFEVVRDGIDPEVAAQSIDSISDAESRLMQNAHAPLCIDGLMFELASHAICS
ncbi:MAG: DNA polymerase III subunit delta' [Phycisphaerae bacterium]|nr:MAG: DNA polymerase III subunit delta' [Phycisphaerae bacterium]